MKIDLPTFWLILWCYVNKVLLDQARKVCDVSKIIIIRWYNKFRDHLPRDKISNIILLGTIQGDEMHGGGRGIKEEDKRYSIIGTKEKQGKDKLKKRKMVLEFIPNPSIDRKDVVEFLSSHVEPQSNFHTDGTSIYKGIDK